MLNVTELAAPEFQEQAGLTIEVMHMSTGQERDRFQRTWLQMTFRTAPDSRLEPRFSASQIHMRSFIRQR